MVINEKYNNKKIYELNQGECFKYSHDYYMVSDEDDELKRNKRCVNLETGIIAYFPVDQIVKPICCELIIKG